jgi:uncharacterized protein YkwD
MPPAERAGHDGPMRSLGRRLTTLALAATLLVALAPAASAADGLDTSSTAIRAAEKDVLALTNRQRTERGLVALRWDSRIAELARDRAAYMADTGRFAHTEADGDDVFDMIVANDISWYGAGEIIAWNTAGPLDYSAQFAVQGWMGSAGHKAIVLSSKYNYVGFGLAIDPDSGKRYWAGVYLKGPDRTGAYSKVKSVTKSRYDSRRTKVTITWGGADTRLQVLTSGLRYFQLQRRKNGGSWYTYDVTTRTSLTRLWTRGATYEFRVRARDRAGNWGSWKSVIIKP